MNIQFHSAEQCLLTIILLKENTLNGDINHQIQQNDEGARDSQKVRKNEKCLSIVLAINQASC